MRTSPLGPRVQKEVSRALEAGLAVRLPELRWFAAKGEEICSVRVADVWVFEMGAVDSSDGSGRGSVPAGLALVNVTTGISGRATYVVPWIATKGMSGGQEEWSREAMVLEDAEAHPAFWPALVGWLLEGEGKRGRRGTLRLSLRCAADGVFGPHPERLVPVMASGEKSNTVVFLGDLVVVKLVRRLLPGTLPEAEMGRVLGERGFEHAPAYLGSLVCETDSGGVSTLVTLHEYVAHDGLAFEAAVRNAEGSLQGASADTASAELMGRRLAEMHLALASCREDPFVPEPYTPESQRAEARTMRRLCRRALRSLEAALPRLEGRVQHLASRFIELGPSILRCFARFARMPLGVARLRFHGDMHLGQILCVGNDFVFIDFEGEPDRPIAERRRKSTPLRDVAGMLRSFHYAACVAEERLGRLLPADGLGAEARAWETVMSAAFLSGYTDHARRAPFLVPKDPEELRFLLNVFCLEKAVYEVAYEIGHRPRNLPIALLGIEELVAES